MEDTKIRKYKKVIKTPKEQDIHEYQIRNGRNYQNMFYTSLTKAIKATRDSRGLYEFFDHYSPSFVSVNDVKGAENLGEFFPKTLSGSGSCAFAIKDSNSNHSYYQRKDWRDFPAKAVGFLFERGFAEPENVGKNLIKARLLKGLVKKENEQSKIKLSKILNTNVNWYRKRFCDFEFNKVCLSYDNEGTLAINQLINNIKETIYAISEFSKFYFSPAVGFWVQITPDDEPIITELTPKEKKIIYQINKIGIDAVINVADNYLYGLTSNYYKEEVENYWANKNEEYLENDLY